MDNGTSLLAVFFAAALFAAALMDRLICYLRPGRCEGGRKRRVPPKWRFRCLAVAIPAVSLLPVLFPHVRSTDGLAILALLLLVSCWPAKYFYDRSSGRHAYFAPGLEADPADPYIDNDLTDLIIVSIAAMIAIASLVTLIAADVGGRFPGP